MNCTEIQNELVAFVLDELNPAERANVERHLASGCSECILQLKEVRESVELLWKAVPEAKLTEELQRDILARALDVAPAFEPISIASGNLASIDRKSSLYSSLPIQSLVAFAAGLLFTFAFHSMAGNRAEPIAVETQQIPDADANLSTPKIVSKLDMTDQMHQSTHLVSLRKRAGSSELRGFVLWDSLSSELHLYCFGLKQPQSGWQYSLWLIGPSVEVRAADRLDVDAYGNCKAVVHWPDGEFNFAKVTVEPSSTMNSRPSENVELTSNAFPAFPH